MNPALQSCHPLTLRIPPLVIGTTLGVLSWLGARAVAPLSFEYTAWPLPTAWFVALGFIFSLSGVGSFRRARTTVNPTRPEATTALVVSGIYRFTRNPMYLGFLCFLLGEAAWLANPVALLGAAAFVVYLNRFQIGPEERALKHHFGADYITYTHRVRRWI